MKITNLRIVVVLVICCCLPQMMSFYLSLVIMTMTYCFLHTAVSEHFFIALTIWKSIAWFEMGFFHIISLCVSLSSRSFTVLMRIGVEHLAMLCIIFPCPLFCSGYDMTLCKWQWVIKIFEENRGHFHFLVQNTHKKINKLFIKPIYDLEPKKKYNSSFC